MLPQGFTYVKLNGEPYIVPLSTVGSQNPVGMALQHIINTDTPSVSHPPTQQINGLEAYFLQNPQSLNLGVAGLPQNTSIHNGQNHNLHQPHMNLNVNSYLQQLQPNLADDNINSFEYTKKILEEQCESKYKAITQKYIEVYFEYDFTQKYDKFYKKFNFHMTG